MKNMKYNRIVFWQEAPSPHQASWIRALAEIDESLNILCIFQQDLSQDRIALGWQLPDYGKAKVLINPDLAKVDEILNTDPKGTVHVFSGMVHNSKVNSALKIALQLEIKVGILSEGRDWRGWRGVLRMAHSLFYERRYSKSVDFVLAIGTVGMKWYRLCGYPENKTFPFCYTVETPKHEEISCSNNNIVQITAIGQLISRKRFDLLIRALSESSTTAWNLKIIGDGKLRHSLESIVKLLGVESRVTFSGVLSNDQIGAELSHSDVLVLPSRWDGWGAVINEALMSGVPAICSDYCGGAELIRPGFNGDIFTSGDLDSLTQVLSDRILKGPVTSVQRDIIKNWSRCIEGVAVAQYVLSIIGYDGLQGEVRPSAPWNWVKL